MLKNTTLLLITLFGALPLNSYAADGTDGIRFYEMIFGNPDQRSASRNNEDSHSLRGEACEGYGGLLGGINSFFCHMEKDMGITGPGSVTKSFGTMIVHAEIIANSVTINTVQYSSQGKVWVCNTQVNSDCMTNRLHYAPAYYIAFTFDRIAGINKGYALSDPGIFQGVTGNASEIIYDIGSTNQNQALSGKVVYTSGTETFKMRVLGTKTTSSFQLNLSAFSSGASGGFRFAMAGSPPASSSTTANVYNLYYENASGAGSNGNYVTDAALLTAPPTANGYCVSANESGSSTTVAPAAGSCATKAFAAFDFNALTASGAGSPNAQAMSAATILGSWQGMPANPSSL